MKLKDIEKFIDLAKEKGVTKLSYEEKDQKVSVSFVAESSGMIVQSPQKNITNPDLTTSAEDKKSEYKEIKSPFVGTFYRSSSPDSPAYVEVGQSISSGQTLCIIEAMKIMNEIESEISGEIVEICVENENYVEFGQTLFKVR